MKKIGIKNLRNEYLDINEKESIILVIINNHILKGKNIEVHNLMEISGTKNVDALNRSIESLIDNNIIRVEDIKDREVQWVNTRRLKLMKPRLIPKAKHNLAFELDYVESDDKSLRLKIITEKGYTFLYSNKTEKIKDKSIEDEVDKELSKVKRRKSNRKPKRSHINIRKEYFIFREQYHRKDLIETKNIKDQLPTKKLPLYKEPHCFIGGIF